MYSKEQSGNILVELEMYQPYDPAAPLPVTRLTSKKQSLAHVHEVFPRISIVILLTTNNWKQPKYVTNRNGICFLSPINRMKTELLVATWMSLTNMRLLKGSQVREHTV